MQLLTLRLKPLEPLMLRGAGEFDPSSRGVYSYASSLILPRPSTMVGVLVSALQGGGASACVSASSWEGMLKECYTRVFDKCGIEALRGPYIVRRGTVYAPVLIEGRLALVDYEQVKHFLLEEYGDVLDQLFSRSEPAKRVVAAMKLAERDLQGWAIALERISLTGIHLKSRKGGGGKVIEEGYIYTARLVPYLPDTEIVFYLLVRDPERVASRLRGNAVKFGGEGRVVRIEVEHFSEGPEALSNYMGLGGAKYAILVSPMPLIGGSPNLTYIGRRAAIGLGFSLAKQRRKPVLPCIAEGSIVRIDGYAKEVSWGDVLRYGLYGVAPLTGEDERLRHLGRLGYASFLSM